MSGELMGGIKNALERGENIESIKESFINAGYPMSDVEIDAQEAMRYANIPFLNITQATQSGHISYPPGFGKQKPRNSKGLIIFFMLLLFITFGAGFAWLYWTQVSPYVTDYTEKAIKFFSELINKLKEFF